MKCSLNINLRDSRKHTVGEQTPMESRLDDGLILQLNENACVKFKVRNSDKRQRETEHARERDCKVLNRLPAHKCIFARLNQLRYRQRETD